jgi:hypothetical protein
MMRVDDNKVDREDVAEGEMGDMERNSEDETEEDDDLERDDQGHPRITLDRYLSKRRAPSRSWPHLISMVLMLITLVLIIIYKDRCGDMVSGLMGDLEPAQGDPQPAVKIQLETKEKE